MEWIVDVEIEVEGVVEEEEGEGYPQRVVVDEEDVGEWERWCLLHKILEELLQAQEVEEEVELEWTVEVEVEVGN